MTRLVALIALAVTSLADAGCGGTDVDDLKFCSEVGCDSGIAVVATHLSADDRVLRVCVDDRCRSKRLTVAERKSGRALLGMRCKAEPATVRLSVSVGDREGTTSSDVEAVALRKSQPNGPDCSPTCWIARRSFDSRVGKIGPYSLD